MSINLIYAYPQKYFGLRKPEHVWALKKLKRWAALNDIDIEGLEPNYVLKKCCEYYFSRNYKMSEAIRKALLIQGDLDKLEKKGYEVKIYDYTPLIDVAKIRIFNHKGKKVLQSVIRIPKELKKKGEIPDINWFKERAFERLCKFVKKKKDSVALRKLGKKNEKRKKVKVKVKKVIRK